VTFAAVTSALNKRLSMTTLYAVWTDPLFFRCIFSEWTVQRALCRRFRDSKVCLSNRLRSP